LGFAAGLLFILYTFFKLVKENRARKQSMHEIRIYADELKRANWTKDMFFSIIAHDLRSPFNSLLNLFDLLSEAISKNDISLIEQNISSIEFSARRTFNLLQNLLEWSKLQTGRLKIVPEFFNINEVIEENIALYKEAANQKSIGLSSCLKDTMVYADRNITSTVIRNLVGNSIKFTEKGGIEIDGVKKENQLIVIIRDTGIGLSEKEISRLFRIEVSTSDIGNSLEKGSGLGLILSKSFVELNKGKIWVESTTGEGSSFYFSIPMMRNYSGK
jgi:signal transduction histidine kinase